MPRLAPHKRLIQRLLDLTGGSVRHHRAWERQVAADPARLDPVDDGRPMPPPELITRVAGTPGQRWFSEHGRSTAEWLAAAAREHGVELARSDLLDLGCGCGRIARWLAPEVVAAGRSFNGVDIQPELIAWCAAHLPGDYRTCRLGRPAPLPDAAVDALYAYSVVTHLTRARTEALLADCARLLRPGGLALITYQDAAFNRGADVPTGLVREGYAVSTRAGEGLNYLSAWVTGETFAALCGRDFEVVANRPSDPVASRQALAVLRRPG